MFSPVFRGRLALVQALRTYHKEFRGINKHFDYKRRGKRVDRMSVPSVQVVGGTPALPPALLYTDVNNKGFLFNAGEGIQRLILESPGLKIGGVTDVIMTRCDWATCASIPGIAIFRRDQMVMDNKYSPLQVWGTDRAGEFLRTTKEELFGQEGRLDDHLNINNLKDLDEAGDVKIESVEVGEGVSCFVVTLPAKKGSVNKDKLKALQLPNKQISSLMKTGILKLDNGTTVHLSDISNPPILPPIFIVVDCRSDGELDVLENIDFAKMTSAGEILLMVHFTPLHLLHTPRYQNFCHKYPVDHLLMSGSATSDVLYDCSIRNSILNSILPIKALYQSPKDSLSKNDNLIEDISSGNGVVKLAQHLLRFHLYSGRSTKVGWNQSQIKPFDFTMHRNNTVSVYAQYKAGVEARKIKQEKFYEATAAKCQSLDSNRSESPVSNKSPSPDSKRRKLSSNFPNITFLGTSSTYASTYRGVSGILLESDNLKILLDCGEMTFGQMVRLWGKDVTLAKISGLDMLYISHIHFDHCAGTLSIAQHYYTTTKTPLLIFCPGRMLAWYKMLSKVFNVPLDLVSIGSVKEKGLNVRILDKRKGLLMSVCPALHCRDAWSLSLSTDKWKLSYSGDTLPNPEFVKIGMDSDILIHEATLESALAKDAFQKRHSTVSQAVDIGRKMNSSYTILTHFSLRYQKYPPIIEENLPDNVTVAHDFMTVTSSNVEEWCNSTSALPIILPAQYADSLKKLVKTKTL